MRIKNRLSFYCILGKHIRGKYPVLLNSSKSDYATEVPISMRMVEICLN